MESVNISWISIFVSTVMIVGTEDMRLFYDKGKNQDPERRIEITSICIKDETRPLNMEAVRRHLMLRRIFKSLTSFDVFFDIKKLASVIAYLFLDKQRKTKLYKDCQLRFPKPDQYVISYMPRYMTSILDQTLGVDGNAHHIAMYTDPPDDIGFIQYNRRLVSEDTLKEYLKDFIFHIVRTFRYDYVTLIYVKKNEYDWPSLIIRERIWNELKSSSDICVEMRDLNASDSKIILSYVESLQIDEKNRLVIVWSSERLRRSISTNGLSEYALWFTELSPYAFHFKSFLAYPRVSFQKTYDSLLMKPFFDSRFSDYNKSVQQFSNENKLKIKFNNLEENKLYFGYDEEWLFRLDEFDIRYMKIRSKSIKDNRFYYNGKYLQIDRILNVMNKKSSRGTKCKPSCPPGEEPVSTVSSKTSFVKVHEWKCKRCGMDRVKYHYSSKNCIPCTGLTVPNENQTKCISSCLGFTVPDKDQRKCIDPYEDMYLSHNDVKSNILIFTNVSFVLFNIVILFIFIYHKNTPIIIASGSTSNISQLIAHLLIFLQVYPLFFGKLNVFKCTFQVITNGTLFTLILSLLFTKIQKTLVAFKSKVRLSRKEVIITQTVEVFITVLLLSIDIVMLLISYHESTPTVETKIDSKTFIRTVICKNEGFFRWQYVYILTLSILCSIQAFRSRNLPKYFSETTEVGRSVFFTVIVVLIRFFIVESEVVDDKNFVNAIFILLINFTQMALRYSKICNTIVFQPEKNTKEYVSNCIFKNTRQNTDESMEMRLIQSKVD